MIKIPKQIIIETSRTCNLRCIGCPINSDENTGPGVFMGFDFFKSIIDRIDFKTTVIPWMNGESLLNPEISKMHKYISAKKIPWYLTTNATIWNEEVFQHITDPDTSCYQIIFSLDGLPGSKSIAAARPGSNPKKVIDTIDRFLELKKQKGSNVDLAVKCVERGQDWEEIEDYILYWLDRGVDYVCSGRMLEQNTPESMRRYPCQYYDNNFMVIRHDGELVLCAYNDYVVNAGQNPLFKVNAGQNPLFKLNSVTPLLDAYNDKRYQYYRDRQNQGIYDGPCENCGFAYTGSGLDGTVKFRKDQAKTIYHRRDYYNSFWSLKDKAKPAEYYTHKGVAE